VDLVQRDGIEEIDNISWGVYMIRILLVDDHPLVGEGTKLIIEKEADMKVDFVTSAKLAMERIKGNLYDVMLIDLQIPEMNGFELSKKVLASNPSANILIFSEVDLSTQLDLFMECGAIGFILKTATREQLIRAIRCAINQEIVVPFTWLKTIYQGTKPWLKRNHMNNDKLHFNEKEMRILKELVKGKTNKQMAQTLFIGQRSLEYCLTGIFQKLEVQNRIEAIVKVNMLGIIDE